MSCILRVSGESLDIDALLAAVRMKPDRVYYKGESRFSSGRGEPNKTSGANFIASDAPHWEFDLQVREATDFLIAHRACMEVIVGFPGAGVLFLDFGIELRDVFMHSDFLSPQFLRAAADAGVTVELSHYPPTAEGKDASRDVSG